MLDPAVRSRSLAFGIGAALLLAGACASQGPSQAPAEAKASVASSVPAETAADRLRTDVSFLASEPLQGRKSGTPDADAAARWIAARFSGLGLTPAGTAGFLQGFDLPSARRLSGIAIEKAIPALAAPKGAPGSLAGVDAAAFAFTLASAPGVAEGKLVDVGEGNAYDPASWEGTDPKIALARLREEAASAPASAPAGPHGSLPPSLRSFAFQARQHQAAGLVVVVPNREAIAKEWGEDRDVGLPVLYATEVALPALLAAGSFRFDAGVVAVSRATQNVLALVPGAAPSSEVVVVGAHYDHLGLGGSDSLAPGVRDIHHGADDNASGSALILELARRFAARSEKLPRAILFAAWGAEELGLLGSAHWVKSPTVPWDRVVANVNFDMVGRSRGRKLDIGGVNSSTGWKELVEAANASLASPLGVRASARLSGVGGSDHMSFLREKRPALFFFTGLHEDYHKPSDTPEKIDYAAMADIADLAERVIVEIARAPKVDFLEPPAPESGAASRGAEQGLRAWFGSIPDYGAEEGGVVLSGTSPGSPAEKAGLKAKDIVKRLGPYEIKNVEDLTMALGRMRPGEEVEVVYVRDAETKTLKLVLGRRR